MGIFFPTLQFIVLQPESHVICTYIYKMSLIQLQGWQNDAALVVRLIKADIMWIDARQSSLDARVQSLVAFPDYVYNVG